MPAPLISIVLPAYDLQGQLADCLDSILEQSFGGFEVIVVTDPSPDCPSRVPHAAQDGRVSVLRLNATVGVGRSRNAGRRAPPGVICSSWTATTCSIPGHCWPWPKR